MLQTFTTHKAKQQSLLTCHLHKHHLEGPSINYVTLKLFRTGRGCRVLVQHLLGSQCPSVECVRGTGSAGGERQNFKYTPSRVQWHPKTASSRVLLPVAYTSPSKRETKIQKRARSATSLLESLRFGRTDGRRA